jgi:hypothetical protein
MHTNQLRAVACSTRSAPTFGEAQILARCLRSAGETGAVPHRDCAFHGRIAHTAIDSYMHIRLDI